MPNRKVVHPPLTQEMLKAALHYDPETGAFTWAWNNKFKPGLKGKPAGSYCTDGYLQIRIYGRREYLAHRLAWLYVHGRWPEHDVDHCNRVKSDNRIANLRLAPPGMNSVNRIKAGPRKYDLPRGVTPDGRRFRAQIRRDGTVVYLGIHDTAEEAHAAYLAAAGDRLEFLPR